MMITIQTPRCQMCQQSTFIEVDVDRLQRFQAGEHIQLVWPDKPADWRELLLTGTHPKCWDDMWKDDNDA